MTVFPVILFVGIGWILVQRFTLAASAGVELARAGPADLNEGTRSQVASFAELGYRELAVYEARFRGGKFSIVVMAGPGGTAWAEVTDRLWEVASTFGPRLLRTVTSSMLPPGPTLVQCVRSAPPRTIVAEHERALALLAERGLSPERLEDDEILARFESETRAARALLGDDAPTESDPDLPDTFREAGEPAEPEVTGRTERTKRTKSGDRTKSSDRTDPGDGTP